LPAEVSRREAQTVAALPSLVGSALRPAAQLAGRAEKRARTAISAPARWVLLSALDSALSALDAALRSSIAEEAVERIKASPLADEVLEPLVGRVLDSPEAERLVRRVIDSRVIDAVLEELRETEALWVLIDQIMQQLPQTETLWLLIDEIAQSPSVTDAISRQGMSFADQLAGVMRNRSRNADDHLERVARRLARRAPRDVAPGNDAPPTGA
jgi:uncharacterized membrane-anchored protein YjiN (DUF445 family)